MKNPEAFKKQFDDVVAEAERLNPLAARATAIPHPPETPEQEKELAGIIDQMLEIYPNIHAHMTKLRHLLPKS